MVAFVVTVGTLLIQGLTLPTLVRALGLHAPDPHEDNLEEAKVHQAASDAGLAYLEEHEAEPHLRERPAAAASARHRPASMPCGSGWAAPRRRARSTRAHGRRCSRWSGPRCCGCATRHRSTRASCGGCSTRSTSRSRSSTGLSENETTADRETELRPVDRAGRLRAPEGLLRDPRRRSRRTGARSACATATSGCTCGSAWSAATWGAATHRRRSMPTGTTTRPATR